ncbi:class I SAM-dependent methyltransferase [Cohnella sp. AR92]|uniref:class I SAM-dependent methyltransferase n=1 Tax=Cohnella sp. AR92 TaxID=648716 RepID=UPI000F8F0B4F|nr:class I SAM-dependent methyltransferase [Cohnella sp. AR92]RUS46971.1 class I SAM-dependent methyltransferase [Cohnella sp. AR92]
MSWNFYNPVFAYDSGNPALKALSAWTGHRRFAYDLARNLKPRTVVELGTAFGVSFFSFCQAAVDSGADTRCFAVDTWLGDPHGGYYSEDIYRTVSAISQFHYPNTATLVRCTFDQALTYFPDASIDVLHIDGYHTYEAAKHDFDTWIPKLAPGGVVLFHDIAERGRDFGVYRVWEGLAIYPRMEFAHSHGLGVLFPKGCPPSMSALVLNGPAYAAHYAQLAHLG